MKAHQRNVIYKEFKVAENLSPYIHCYWILKTDQLLDSPYSYKVVSDGCIDIFFDLHNPASSSIMGFCKKYTEFSIGTSFSYGGIRFYPSVFPYLFDISANLFKNKDQPLHLHLPDVAKFIADNVNIDFQSNLHKLNDYFTDQLSKTTSHIDKRFLDAFIYILKQKGHLELESELNVGISSRQLRRLFKYYIGTTPKSFAQVVRFQYILNAKPSSQSLKESKIFYDVGFYDQAHFIKNFKTFYGVTPMEAFQ